MMIDENSNEWRELTFSQREGKAPLPEALQVGELTTKFRNQVWFIIKNSIDDCSRYSYDGVIFNGESAAGVYWSEFPFSYHLNILNIRHDQIDLDEPRQVIEWLNNLIFNEEYHEVITPLEFMLRFPSIPENLANGIEQCFEFAPYWIDRSSESICILPATSKEMKENTKRALDNINQSALTGIKSHLRKAAQELNNKNFADSIRESIHAVESTVRQIAPESSKTLAPALDSLKKGGIYIHPVLEKAFKKLYGYTSDEKGIRHAFTNSDVANVEFDEAIFMYGACVSFVDYLVSKQRQIGENDPA